MNAENNWAVSRDRKFSIAIQIVVSVVPTTSRFRKGFMKRGRKLGNWGTYTSLVRTTCDSIPPANTATENMKHVINWIVVNHFVYHCYEVHVPKGMNITGCFTSDSPDATDCQLSLYCSDDDLLDRKTGDLMTTSLQSPSPRRLLVYSNTLWS